MATAPLSAPDLAAAVVRRSRGTVEIQCTDRGRSVTDESRFPQQKSPAFENREDRGSLSVVVSARKGQASPLYRGRGCDLTRALASSFEGTDDNQ
jgi:hypothetical protein